MTTSLREDLARAAAVRSAIGDAARLMVDALLSLDMRGAARLAEGLRAFDLHILEAPTRRDDVAGWADLRARTGAFLSGPELEHSLPVMLDARRLGAVDSLQVDATVGGIAQVRRAASLAQAFHRPTTLHSSGSAVAFAANAQVAAALPGCDGWNSI